MGRAEQIAKNYVVNKWQNSFLPLYCVASFFNLLSVPQTQYLYLHSLFPLLWRSSHRLFLMAMSTVSETTCWSVGFPSEAPARECESAQSSWSYQRQASQGRCSTLLILFSIWIKFGNTIMVLHCFHHNLLKKKGTLGNDFKCFYLYWQESFVQFSNMYLWHMSLSIISLSLEIMNIQIST